MATVKRITLIVALGTIVSAGLNTPATAQTGRDDLALDEIVVTAQRRAQALQEVPISIEAISGAEIQRQGYRDLNELANFSPSVYIDEGDFLTQDRSIRGFGTFGNALTLEQAVPIFVDGIHFGRPSQVKLAFLDPARVEILKGPQPVFFGMNATAGAFNIESAKPTPEWEGYMDAEFGNNDTGVVRAAYGGPLTDTLGIRVAGTYESADGFITDVVTGADKGGFENFGARLILQWAPRENFEVSFKHEYSEIDKNAEATSLCRTGGSLVFQRNRDGTTAPPGEQGNERAIWADPPDGAGWDTPHVPLDFDCFDDIGVSNDGPFFAPPDNVREENSNFGAIDARAAIDEWVKRVGVTPGGINEMGEDIEASNGYIDLIYRFNNGIETNWKTGWSVMDRVNSRDNSNTPFLLNMQNRGQDFDQYSTELRFTSSGDGNIEWMAGLLWQKTDQDIISNSPRANVRRGLRSNVAGEEQEWKTAFATVTFNFMDDKASIDLGGRYTDLDKSAFISGVGADWVFDVFPCDPDQTDPPGGPGAVIDPAACAAAGLVHEDAVQLTAAETEFLLPGADVNNLWVIPWRASRDTPLSWIGSRAAAVGMTIPDPSVRNGPYGPGNGGDFDDTEFNPQVTIRYRPTENHSLFFRWAESFKAGGFDTGVTSINEECSAALINAGVCATPFDNFRFEGESAETFELGSKGALWDGRARYDVTLFETTFEDLQVASDTGDPDDPFININAGEQRVRGIEFSIIGAVSEQLTLSFAGTLMDGELTDFPNAGCTEDEIANADTGPCLNAAEAEALFGLDDDGDPIGEDTINRTGTAAPKTPDWKFVLGLDFETPIWSDYVLAFDAKGYISDGFIIDASGFSKDVMMNEHEDLNLTLGIGPQDGTWQLAVYGRNLLEAREEYNPQFDPRANGTEAAQLSRSDFRSYGLKLRYNFE